MGTVASGETGAAASANTSSGETSVAASASASSAEAGAAVLPTALALAAHSNDTGARAFDTAAETVARAFDTTFERADETGAKILEPT